MEGKDITPAKVKALTDAAEACWNAIMAKDLEGFAASYRASFEAQVAMFPGMVHPLLSDGTTTEAVVEAIRQCSQTPDVLAWKMPGAGGGGYLALVVRDTESFCVAHPDAISLRIRR